MSNTIDQRVVEMRFDNKHFESNVQSSLSTLDKLKQKLNLTGASKGLDNIGHAAKNVDLSGLSGAVETVRTRFSALDVIGVTALANITNSAVNAGKKMISALTIDPIKTGFNEYETQINSVQTILSNTKNKGSTIDDVNAALDELNKYADQTIYNFTEMTRNIGTFTAAGVDLDTSVSAIQGIANLAAVSGSTSQQASTAMYQLSQALASGTVKLMDWNSVVNAGMGGEVFQNALKETSRLLGTGAEEAIKAEGSFRDSLHTGWLTSEVLTETLKKFTTSGANEYVAEYTGLSKKTVEAALKEAEAMYGEADAIDKASEALAKKSGKNKKEIKEALEFAKGATDAATKVKTFTQLWDVMKESAQSGWAQTWKIIVGDFEEAKNLLTPLADFFTGIIGKFSDARNKLLESALGKSFSSLGDKISGVLKPVTKAADTVKNVTNTISDLGDVVDNVIGGKFGNGVDRFNALTDAGINYYKVQNKVNEKLGNSHRYTKEQIEAQEKLLTSQGAAVKTTSEAAKETTKLSKADKELLVELSSLSDEQLKAKGYTKEQIAAINELRSASEKLGIPMKDFIQNLDEINGRWLIINSFKNIGHSIIAIFKSIGKAWGEIFDPVTGDQLFNVIAAIHKFSTYLRMSDDTAKKLQRTFKGVFAALDIVLTLVGGPLKIAFKLLTQLLGVFHLDIWDVTAAVGDAIVKFRDWMDSTLDFTKVFEKLAPYIKAAATAVSSWIDNLKGSDAIQTFSSFMINAIDNICKWIDTLKESDNIPRDIILGLVKGLSSGVKAVWDAALEIGRSILDSIKSFLGIHSPSTAFIAIGGFIISGLVIGLLNGVPEIQNAVKGISGKITEFIGNINWGTVFSSVVTVGMLGIMNKFASAFETLVSPLEGLGDVFEGAGKVLDKSAKGIGKILKNTAKVVKSFSKILNAVAFNIRTDGIKNLAISLLILVGALAIVTLLDPDRLWESVIILGALSGILVALAVATEKLSASSVSIGKDGAKLSGLKSGLIAIGASLLLLAFAVKLIGSLEPDQAKQGFIGLAGLVVSVIAVLGLYGTLVKGKAAQNMDKAGKMLTKMAVSLLLMVAVVKLISGMTPGELKKGGIAIAAFVGIVGLLALVSRVTGRSADKLGGMMIKLSVSMLLMVGVIKLISGMTPGELLKGGAAILGFVWIIGLLSVITHVAGGEIKGLSGVLLSMSVSMLLMVGVIKLISGMTPGELIKGGAAILAFVGIIALLTKIIKSVGSDAPKIAATLLAMSVSIGILAAVALLLGLIDIKSLIKGVAAIDILGGIMTSMIRATRGASDCKGNLIVMTVAIGVMAVAIAALSLIDGTKLAGATIALGTLMAIFASMIKASRSAKGSIGSLIVMTVAIGLLGGLVYLLAQLPLESVMGSAIALSALLLAVSAALVIVSKFSSNIASALLGVLALTAMALPLLAFVGILALMQNIQNAMSNVMALTVLATALTILLVPLTLVGAFGASALLGVLALTAMALPLLAFVGILALMQNIQNAMTNVKTLTLLMGTMTAMLVVLAIVGPLALIGVHAMTALTALIVAIGVLAVGIGALMDEFPALESFLDKGIPILEKLANAIGSVIGNLISGFMTGIASGLPEIGTQLSTFMTNAMPFIMGSKMIDSKVTDGIKSLAEAILIITAADIVNGLASWLTGESSLAGFGEQLGSLGTSLKTFSDNLGTFDEAKVATVTCAANAIKAMASAASELPNEGGWLASLVGDNNIGTFGEQLPTLAEHINGFVSNLGTFDETKVAAVKCATDAIKAIAEASSELPNEGGWLASLVGDNTITTFGKQLPALAEHINGFVSNLGTFDEAKVTTVTCAANAIKAIAEVASELPNEGGWLANLVGDNAISNFGSQLGDLGTNISDFATNVGDASLENTNKAVSILNSLVGLSNTNLSDSGSNLKDFGDDIVSLSANISEFSDNVGGVENISIAIARVRMLINMAKTISASDIDSTNSFSKSLKTLGKNGVKDFIDSFTGASPKTKVTDAAKKMLDNFINAVKGKKQSVKKTFESVASTALKAVKNETNYDDFKSAGKYLVDGFASGITAQTFKAKAAAEAMARAAIKAAEEALDENSPSKVFYGIGEFAGLGFVNALTDYNSAASKAGGNLARSSIDGLKYSIGKISDIISSDIDAQPTIRPVLDLSDVRSGVGEISGMMSGRRTLFVDTRSAGIISTSMSKFQNGSGTGEIVSSLRALRKDIADMPRNSYQINGLTYDDGTNVSDAIKTIIRAARVERRS